MKAVSLQDMVGPNPAFDPSAARKAKRRGESYDVPPEIQYPAGTTFDDPQCWVHCVRSPPSMRPADDACRKKVHAWLNHKGRKALLARFKHLATPVVYDKCPKWLQQYIDAVNAKWGDEIQSVEADTTATSGDIRQAIEDMGGEVVDDEEIRFSDD